jgi:L-fucose mutarotase
VLKGVDPLLSGDLLQVLDDMGHGDVLAVVDRNFPAHASGRPVIRISSDAVRVVEAVLSVFPLDGFVDQPIGRMGPEEDPALENPTQAAVLAAAHAAEGSASGVEPIPRFAFYERVRGAYAVIQTLETAPYCCFVFTKGVIAAG